MADVAPTPSEGLAPTQASDRITTLDAIRGVAVLGILAMNAVSFGLEPAAYWNIGAGGIDTWFDWVIGGAGEIFVDQKFMGLFSMLFGAGIVLFFERARDKGRRAGWLSFWRNLLLLGIGILHGALWDGDVLILYAICSIFLIALHRLNARALFALGGLAILAAVGLAIGAQAAIDTAGTDLDGFWQSGEKSLAILSWFFGDAFLRALGMMLIGVALYRTGVITGARSPAFYRRVSVWGFGIGLPLSIGGFTWMAATDFSPDVAIVGAVPNTVATLPLALAYLSLVALWNLRPETGLHRRIHAVGRMALTNYLAQTIIGVIVLRTLFEPDDLNRSWILLFIVAVWVVQLVWSRPWLDRFRYGPFEWVWRCATYRRIEPLRT
ncbi:MAG: DUF418 domain-containing protein [Dehalococcoidia bacterium]|nr:DUF418 domain-containing protein [Dehalococcoidia bacterium]MYA52562.1 DUF418 domain-containing protein [Dehalococcoidia bacterium]